MYPAILFILAICSALVFFALSSKTKNLTLLLEHLLLFIIIFNIGIACLIGFIGHAFYGPEIAAKIGWPAHNPFQFEVAIANLSIGVAGILCIWIRKNFWVATTLISGIFYLGAAYGHIVQIDKHHNLSEYNSGVFLYVGDIIIPIIYLFLGTVYFFMIRGFENNE